MQEKNNELRGILHKKKAEQHYQLTRYSPHECFSHFVEQYWLVRWDLTNKADHLQENLPHPNIHLVIEENNVRVVGIVRNKYSYLLSGKGEIFGVKFLPAAINSLLKIPFNDFIDSSITLKQAFGCCDNLLIEQINATNNDQEKIVIIENFLSTITPVKNNKPDTFHHILNIIEKDHSITSVDLLEKKTGIHKRSLQRLFKEKIALSPKWIIRKYRLHHALHLLEEQSITILDLVTILGYTDQAHLINDFKNILGVTPRKYTNT